MAKNFKKLWLTNWRIKPSDSWEAPNHTSPPPCFFPCSRLSVLLRSPTSLPIEILRSTFSNISATLACPSLYGLGSRRNGTHCRRHFTPHPTYFTQVAMNYPHLQHSSGQTVAFGHYEDPLPDQIATKLPLDPQGSSYHCSGYRSPRLSPGSNRLPPDDVTTIIKVTATLSYYVARQVRRNQESSKLLILTPHNDTVDDLLDAVGLPPDNLPPSLYEFYLVMIYKQQLLPTTLAEFTRTDHKGKPYTPLLENVTFHEIHAKICNDSTLHQDLERRATIETIVQIALDFPKGFSSYCTISYLQHSQGLVG